MTESKQSTRMAYYAIEAYYVRKYNYLIISKMDIYKLSSKSTSNIVHRFFFYYLKISVWGFRESKMFLVIKRLIKDFFLSSVSLTFSEIWLGQLIQFCFCALRTFLSEIFNRG